jgi:hypothetical protein
MNAVTNARCNTRSLKGILLDKVTGFNGKTMQDFKNVEIL